MKKLLTVAVVCAIAAGCQTQIGYKIKGHVEGVENDAVLLLNSNDMTDTLGVVTVVDGDFDYSGKASEPVVALLVLGERRVLPVMVEEGEIVISGDSIGGTPANDAFRRLAEDIRALQQRAMSDSLMTPEKRAVLNAEYDQLINASFDANTGNIFGVYMLNNFTNEDAGSMLERFGRLTPAMQKTVAAVKFHELARQSARHSVGNEYSDFTLPDVNGADVALSSAVSANKYTLLDFWATWCGPCMAEMPHLKEAYALYHDLGFEIFGVSLDSSSDAWRKVAGSSDMPWINVLESSDRTVSETYSIKSIPSNFLISQDGVIVARNLRGAALSEKLNELLK